MKNFPIKFKLTLGFGILLLMLVASGAVSYYYFTDNLKLFTTYRGLARDTNLMGRVQANLLMVRMNMKDYLITHSDKDLQQYAEYMEKTQAFLQEAQKEIQNPTRKKLVNDSYTMLADYGTQFSEVKRLQQKRDALVEEMDITGPQVERALTAIMDTAKRDGDVIAAYYAGRALRNLLLGRLYATKFLQQNAPEAAERVRKEFTLFTKNSTTLDQEVENPERRAFLEKSIKLSKQYRENFESVTKTILARNTIIAQKLDVWGPKIAKNLEVAKLSVKDDQDRLGPQVQKQSAQAQNTNVIITIGAIIIALLAGMLITRSITSPLQKAKEFATAIAAGDFTKILPVHQKDESGQICEALEAIKTSVTRSADEVEKIVAGVEEGHIQRQGDATAFSGSYADLVGGVNTLVEVYVKFLEQLPVGVMSLSQNHTVRYLNKTAKTISGATTYEGKICSDLFNTDDCNTKACASDNCMRTRNTTNSETISNPETGTYEIAYTSFPLITREGEVAGAVEVIIDQSEIKQAQRTMLEVANRANAIADQVAAASQQLAVKVEEVSDGAEIQQQRISETATAMEEMNATVLEVAQNATMATQQSDNAKEKAEEGAGLVNRVIDDINQINTISLTLQNDMEQLTEQAEAIGGVMTVITDIADQTNLLALNAAIEAARAGDAGRGFAVVADEVRKLAEKTMSATNEVGQNIRNIQTATEHNMQRMNSAVENVQRATGLASESGDALSEIVERSTNSQHLISSIATAAEQQSATSEEITSAVEEINGVVQQTTNGVVESVAAVQELAQIALDLKEALSELR